MRTQQPKQKQDDGTQDSIIHVAHENEAAAPLEDTIVQQNVPQAHPCQELEEQPLGSPVFTQQEVTMLSAKNTQAQPLERENQQQQEEEHYQRQQEVTQQQEQVTQQQQEQQQVTRQEEEEEQHQQSHKEQGNQQEEQDHQHQEDEKQGESTCNAATQEKQHIG